MKIGEHTKKLTMLQPDMIRHLKNYRFHSVSDHMISQIYRFSLADTPDFNCTAIQDASVDIIFYTDRARKEQGAFLVGPSKKLKDNYITFKGGYKYIGIRFKPGYPLVLGGTICKDLYDCILHLEKRYRDLPEQISMLFNQNCNLSLIRQILSCYISISDDRKAEFCRQMIDRILIHTGGFRCAILANQFGYSEYYINKIFHAYTGYSLKAYWNLLRIHRLLNSFEDGIGIPEYSRLAVDLGYSDQAHMIREFRKYIGTSPHKFWKTGCLLSER